MQVGLEHYLVVSALLFSIGLMGVVMRRNLILIYMSLELMLNAANLALVAFSRFNDNLLLDFTRISEESDVHFAHARGFMAKTSATTPERLKSLMTSALGSE